MSTRKFRPELIDPVKRANALFDAVGSEVTTLAYFVFQDDDVEFIQAVIDIETRSRNPPRKTLINVCNKSIAALTVSS